MINIAKGIIAGLVASAVIMGAVFPASPAGLAPAAEAVNASSGIMLTPTEPSWTIAVATDSVRRTEPFFGPLL